MGLFSRMRENYATIKLAKEKLDYLSQFPYLPDVSNCEIAGDWMLYRNQSGDIAWYVTEGEKPLYVEGREKGLIEGTYALVCSYYSDRKGNSDPRYVIARGTNEGLDVWFKVGEDFGATLMTVGNDGTALFYDDGNEKLHIIDLEGNHKTKQVSDYYECAMSENGFFWWSDENDYVQINGYAIGSEKALNKKVKLPDDEQLYFDNAELCNDGVHVYIYKDGSLERIFICDFKGNITEETW